MRTSTPIVDRGVNGERTAPIGATTGRRIAPGAERPGPRHTAVYTDGLLFVVECDEHGPLEDGLRFFLCSGADQVAEQHEAELHSS